jgi:hypothetical protein
MWKVRGGREGGRGEAGGYLKTKGKKERRKESLQKIIQILKIK